MNFYSGWYLNKKKINLVFSQLFRQCGRLTLCDTGGHIPTLTTIRKMAYGLIIAAVRPEKFSDFKTKLRGTTANKNSLPFLDTEKIVITTHFYLSAGTGDQALNATLADLFESGEKIDDVYWHPYRRPLYQDNKVVWTKILAFKKTYEDMLSKIPKDDVQYWNMDFSPILNVVDFTAQNNLSLLTFLDKPMDDERANKVHYPVNIRTDPK